MVRSHFRNRSSKVMAIGVIGFIAAGCAALNAGCASVSAPIRLEGTTDDLGALSGAWSGEYAGEGINARHGTISFTLVRGEGHAHGDVLMTPAGSSRAYERYRATEPRMPAPSFSAPSQALTIRFVRVEGGAINGVLDPYWDPDRECQVFTTFHGRMNGRTIEGTFISKFEKPAADVVGHWLVTRR